MTAVELDLKVVHRALPDALVTARVFQRLRHDAGAAKLERTVGSYSTPS